MKSEKQSYVPSTFLKTLKDLWIKNGAYSDPETYNHVVEKIFKRTTFAKDLVEVIKKENKKEDANTLDLGSGTGAISLELARKNPRMSITSADYSQDMLQKLKQESQNNGFSINTVNIEFNQRFPFEVNSFDIITTANANRYIENMPIFIDEIKRVLKSEGVFIWPILLMDRPQWKRNAGIKQPTSSRKIKKILENSGFEVKREYLKPLFRGIFKGIPIYTIPTYLIIRKSK